MSSKFDRFFSMSLDMLATAGFDGCFKDLNPAWERQLGWTIAELTSKPFVEFIHPDDREKTLAESANLGKPGYETIGFENRYACKDGSYKWLAWRATASAEEGLIYAAARDVTDQRRALEERDRVVEELRQAQSASEKTTRELIMLKAIFEATPDMIAFADPHGVGQYINPGGLALVGASSLESKPLSSMHPPDVGEFIANEVIPTALRDGLWQGESALLHADGSVIPVSQVAIAIKGASGELMGFGTICRDIREAKRLESELRRRHAIQQEALHAMASPIIQVWDQIVTLPVVGIVDSVRAADMKEALLGAISRSSASFAIVDLTGVETVDTATADHLLKVMRSVKLLGAQGVITGIQPQVSQIMVALGVDMREVITLRSLREGLRFCLRRMGYKVEKPEEASLI